jgi:hypothetical protein
VHKDVPHIAKHGVVYRFRGRAEVPRSIDDRNVGYQLLELRDSLWAHARDCGPHAVFSSLMDFRGARCGAGLTCPRAIGAQLVAAPGHSSTGAPWEESPGRGCKQRGEAFFDPAYALSRRLRFPAPFSLDYRWNPYLGVAINR